MAETGNPLTPPVMRGAIVQLAEDFGVILPNIIPFQYNPGSATRGLKPWDPSEVDPTNQLLARRAPRRLSAEELRDSMLSVSGELNLEMGGIPARPQF